MIRHTESPTDYISCIMSRITLRFHRDWNISVYIQANQNYLNNSIQAVGHAWGVSSLSVATNFVLHFSGVVERSVGGPWPTSPQTLCEIRIWGEVSVCIQNISDSTFETYVWTRILNSAFEDVIFIYTIWFVADLNGVLLCFDPYRCQGGICTWMCVCVCAGIAKLYYVSLAFQIRI